MCKQPSEIIQDTPTPSRCRGEKAWFLRCSVLPDFPIFNNLSESSASSPENGIVVEPLYNSAVRFHGRNYETWFKRDITVEERFNYLYTKEELAGWVPKIELLASQTKQIHVLMNNCYHDYAVRNTKDMISLLNIG